MRRRWRARCARRTIFIGLLTLQILFSGCVYWRLYRLRGQFGEFTTYFNVTANPGPDIEFLHPVLHTDDIEWLIGLPPRASRDQEGKQVLHWVFVKKEGGSEEHEDVLTEIDCEAIVRFGRVIRIRLPVRFNDVVNQDVLDQAFRGADVGDLNSIVRETGWLLHRDLDIPNEGRIRDLLGMPNRFEESARHRIFDYLYYISNTHATMVEEASDAVGQFIFDRECGRLVQARIQVGVLIVVVQRDEGERYYVTLRRDE